MSGGPTITLRTGDAIPVLGLGTWLAPKGAVASAVTTAIKTGYRAIDCAAMYQNENEVGDAIKAAIDEGTVTRKDLFITSKLMPTDCVPELVIPAVEKTLAELKLEYLDLYLVHWPFFLKPGATFPPPMDARLPYSPELFIPVWKVLEGLVAAGKIKNLGVSNMSAKKLYELLPLMTIPPAVNQVESHPCCQQKKLLAFCKSQNIILTAYSPLGSPARPDRLKAEGDPAPLYEEAVLALAAEKAVSPAQVLIVWAIKRGTVVIPKSVTDARIVENFDSLSKLDAFSEEDLAKLDGLDRADGSGKLVKGHPFVLEGQAWQELWDEDWAPPAK